MRSWLLNLLICIECGESALDQTVYQTEGAEIMFGVIECSRCDRWYPISKGIPRMLLVEEFPEIFQKFQDEFRSELNLSDDLHDLVSISGKSSSAPKDIKGKTAKIFGYEWMEYKRFGWDDPKYDIGHEEDVFKQKSLFKPSEINRSLVLDAGCGNGRYSYWAAKHGAQVVGVDLSEAVDVAFENLRHLQNAAIVQADVFRLPFRSGAFDSVFSIGVLMHTGNPLKAFSSLTRCLIQGGNLTAHVYGKGNFIYELIDKMIRRWTTQLSIENLQKLSQVLFGVARSLDLIGIRPLVNCFVRLDEHHHMIFDWYAAPIATHHTYSEVTGWFEGLGFDVIRTNRDLNSTSGPKRFVMKLLRYPFPVTVRGVNNS